MKEYIELIKQNNDAFANCTALRQISIPSGIETLKSHIFFNCDALEFNVYEGMNYLGNEKDPYLILMGVQDTSRTTLLLHPKTVFILNNTTDSVDGSSIDTPYAAIEVLHLGESVEYIEMRTFYRTDALTRIEVAHGNKKYHAAGNCLIETNTKTLIKGCKSSIIPNDGTVTVLGAYSFAMDSA